jgi:hypothetical protein
MTKEVERVPSLSDPEAIGEEKMTAVLEVTARDLGIQKVVGRRPVHLGFVMNHQHPRFTSRTHLRVHRGTTMISLPPKDGKGTKPNVGNAEASLQVVVLNDVTVVLDQTGPSEVTGRVQIGPREVIEKVQIGLNEVIDVKTTLLFAVNASLIHITSNGVF